MKRTFTMLALAGAFGLALPTTSEAAPRWSKHKTSHSSHRHHHDSGPAVSRGGRAPMMAARGAPHYAPRYYGGGFRGGPLWYGAPPRHDSNGYGYPPPPRRGLLWFLFGL